MSLLLQILGFLLCVGVVAFVALMVHDFKTDYRRFAEINRRRDARKQR